MSNPDLPYRVQHNKEINRTVDRATWLTGGAKGYTDYPFSEVTKSWAVVWNIFVRFALC